ncbi:MAG: DUF3347 domain-containing protein [Cyclobacteriaceae bacterium]|nr:DUF3347 domain-containing protein [Cyclobacteriaceae bacterium]
MKIKTILMIAVVAAIMGACGKTEKAAEEQAQSATKETNEALKAVTIASTEDIEAQRTAFETLSINLYEVAKDGGAGMTVYKQFCPMAFDDKGAFWLSSEKKVMNPYFGASMLRCGKVQEEIN